MSNSFILENVSVRRTGTCNNNNAAIDIVFPGCSFQIQSVGTVTFLWAYQKQTSSSLFTPGAGGGRSYKLQNDKAIIYSVNITNTVVGGAGQCRKCPKGANVEG